MKTLKLENAHVWHGGTYGPGEAVEVPDDFPPLDEQGQPIDERAPEDTLQGQAQIQSRAADRTIVEEVAVTEKPTPEPPAEVKILNKRASDAAKAAQSEGEQGA